VVRCQRSELVPVLERERTADYGCIALFCRLGCYMHVVLAAVDDSVETVVRDLQQLINERLGRSNC